MTGVAALAGGAPVNNTSAHAPTAAIRNESGMMLSYEMRPSARTRVASGLGSASGPNYAWTFTAPRRLIVPGIDSMRVGYQQNHAKAVNRAVYARMATR